MRHRRVCGGVLEAFWVVLEAIWGIFLLFFERGGSTWKVRYSERSRGITMASATVGGSEKLQASKMVPHKDAALFACTQLTCWTLEALSTHACSSMCIGDDCDR